MSIGQVKEILAPQAGAANSAIFDVADGRSVTLICHPNMDTGTVTDVEISHDGGDTFKSYTGTTDADLDDTRNTVNLIGPALYRAAKDATTASIGLYLQR